MIEPHVHCAECFREIPTKIKIAGGKTKDAQIRQGMQIVMVATPEGLAGVHRQVPVCDSCWELIEQQAKRTQAASKLIVPKMMTPKPGAVQ